MDKVDEIEKSMIHLSDNYDNLLKQIHMFGDNHGNLKDKSLQS